jgi:pimeloyl-ACP methyl ester carboxylesterase
MTRYVRTTLAVAAVLAAAVTAQAADSRLVSIKTLRDVTQVFILVAPAKPSASVILFAGGSGRLGLMSASSMTWGASNFVVRTRDMFAAHGFAVAVVDALGDRHQGLNAIFRMSAAHAADIAAVAAFLKKQTNVAVWLVGTSMGTFSAAGGAIAAGDVDGLVLTSTITSANPRWHIAKTHPDGVASMALSRITVPTLIVAHRNDGCKESPASGAAKLKSRLTRAGKVEIVLLDGGRPPKSKPCEALAQHGYFGIEDKAVGAIAKFIKANTR